MTKRSPHDARLDEYLKGDSPLTRAYRQAATDQPPRKLDALILDEAARAVKRRGGFSPFGSRWSMPLAAAAMVVLSVGLVLLMSQQGLGPDSAGVPAPSELASLPDKRQDASEPSQLPAEMTPARERRATAADRESARSLLTAPAAPAVVQEKAAISKLDAVAKPALADVIAVEVSGAAGAYQLNVTIMSPDTGCAQYANWWEVVGEDGRLLYRRVLAHSHVDEQPFARSGGPVPIPARHRGLDSRTHAPGRLRGQAMKGSVKSGFRSEELRADFAAALVRTPPLPDGCAF